MRGSSQNGMRLYNERLVLSLIRSHDHLPKAEIARATGLSAQTVSVIVRQLQKDGLLISGKPQRGKVGQPLVPFSLNPDGAFSIGLKVGRRSGDLMLIDLTGKIRATVHQPYLFPNPRQFLEFAEKGLKQLLLALPKKHHRRIAGIGVATPFELWNWGEEIGAPPAALDAWRNFDMTVALSGLCAFPVYPCNDATAACAAELVFGSGHRTRDYAYFYVGYFIGGGLVLNGTLFQGRNGNAGALGSIPVTKPKGGSEQLIRAASFFSLEKMLQENGRNPDMLWHPSEDWSAAEPFLRDWITNAAKAMAQACAAIASITECSEIVIDGAMPPNVRQRLVAATEQALSSVNLSGITPFKLRQGEIGRNARAMGAASLPFLANYIIDRDILFKDAA